MINTLGTSLLYLTIAMSLMVGTPNHLFSQTTPRQQPGAEVSFYAPDQHDLYDGRWILSGSKLHMVGTLDDPPGWDHMDNDASDVHPVDGSVEIDVNEIENTGSFVARMEIPEGASLLKLIVFTNLANARMVALLRRSSNTAPIPVAVMLTGPKHLSFSQDGVSVELL